jgi:hypothetical protein
VYEPEQRRLAVALLREVLELKHVEMTPAEAALFAERTRLFMVDHQGGRKIAVSISGVEHALGSSGADGRFGGVVRLPAEKLRTGQDRLAQIQAVLPPGDPRQFTGWIIPVENRGVTVVSDIDDTIKLSQVRDRKALLRGTFLEPFQAVPGMAEVFRGWAERSGAQFCYVSASPWQLYGPLSDFIRSNGFPAGAFQLKQFRWKDESFLKLFDSPEEYKPAVIEPLLTQFPRRQFVLVGDSGERDPEIYADLARRYPQQIARVLIRDVTGESAGAERYRTAFSGVSPGVWRIFRTPSEIADACPRRLKD